MSKPDDLMSLLDDVVFAIIDDVIDSFKLAGATEAQITVIQDYVANHYGNDLGTRANAQLDDDASYVWVLSIEHRHGVDTFVHQTHQEAENHLTAYVDDWWGNEFPDVAAPGDDQERVQEYFERMQGNEVYSLVQATVLP